MKSTLLLKQVVNISEELKVSLTGLIIEIESEESIRLIYRHDNTTYSTNCSSMKHIHDTLNYLRLLK